MSACGEGWCQRSADCAFGYRFGWKGLLSLIGVAHLLDGSSTLGVLCQSGSWSSGSLRLCWEAVLRPSIWGWDLICQRLLGLLEEQQLQNVAYSWLSEPCIQKSAAKSTKPSVPISHWCSNPCKIISPNSSLVSSKHTCMNLWSSAESNDR